MQIKANLGLYEDEVLDVLLSIRSYFARSLTNEKACNCLLRTQTCDHIGIMKQYDMTVGPISQIILDQIKFGADGPGAVKFDSNRLFCKLCSPLIIVLSSSLLLSGHFMLWLIFGTSSGHKII